MRVGQRHCVDVFGVDARGLEIRDQSPRGGTKQFGTARSGVEKHQLAPGVDDERILLKCDVLGRQIVVRKGLGERLLGNADEEVGLRLAKIQRTVGDNRALEGAELEAIEGGCLRVGHGRPGQCRACEAFSEQAHGRQRGSFDDLTPRGG